MEYREWACLMVLFFIATNVVTLIKQRKYVVN